MNRKLIIQLGLVAGLLAVAGVLGFGYWHNQTVDLTEKVYFYDLTQQKLFGAPRASVPPIAGLNGQADGAVRAIVVTATGNPREKKQLTIAYLEKYTPEMKALFESLRQAEAAGKSTAGMIPHGIVPRSTLVRRLTDTKWHPMTSAEGERIVSGWNVPDASGRYPVVCVP
jgi:hypothetical protein